jgi:hypothetical protein
LRALTDVPAGVPAHVLGLEGAAWFSLIETAKLNGIKPYLYLCCILGRLPESDDPEAYRFLLPWSIPKEALLDFESGRMA